MAGLTLLAIVSFLFLPVILDLVGGGAYVGGGPINTIAESRRFGKITEIDLHRLQEDNDTLRRFLQVLYENLRLEMPSHIAESANEEQMQAFQEHMRSLQPLAGFVNQVRQLHQPEQLIDAWLLTRFAQEEGHSPDWNNVAVRLSQVTGNRFTREVYNATLQSSGLSHQVVERLLVQHLQWERLMERFSMSVSAVSPANRWDWFQRLNRRVTVEAAAVPVDSFVGQVAEPSVRILNAFFEVHKSQRHDALSAEVGFIMPLEISFQYVLAVPTEAILDSITEEEMSAYYEENKDSEFRRPVRPLPEMPTLPGLPGGTAPFPTPGFPTPGRVITPTLPVLDDLPPLDEEPIKEPINENTEGLTPPADEETDSEESDSEKSTEPEPVQSEDDADAASEESETTAGLRRSVIAKNTALQVTTRLVSYQADEESGESAGASPEEPPTESPDNNPVDLSVLYRPFDEVKGEIRMTLASEKAEQALPVIQAEMRKYTQIYNEHFEQGRQIPPMPDLTAFVAEQGLELLTVPMGDIHSALQTELARDSQAVQHIGQMFRSVPLLFESSTFWTMQGTALYWITEMQLERRPERLAEVRDIVENRWKEVEARTLAQKKAEELANEVRASGKPLAEALSEHGNIQVVETEPFTWRTFGNMHPLLAVYQGRLPDFGEVRELGVAEGFSDFDNEIISLPGTGFMEMVYSLQIGEVGVVFNQPQTVAYIVRLTGSSPSFEALWERFQTAQVWEYIGAGQQEQGRAAYEAWLNEIRERTGFRWVNRPETMDLRFDSDW